MLILQQVSYTHPDKELLFSEISFTLQPGDKVALVGNNGSGKSTLLRLVAQQLQPTKGEVILREIPYYVPQLVGQFDHLNVAQVLNVDQKLKALSNLLNGSIQVEDADLLNGDWLIEERCKEALAFWNLQHIDLFQPLGTLSGGEKVKVFLSGILIHQPAFILMDEPGNHLDTKSLEQLYSFIDSTTATMMIVSHDRKLLNHFSTIYELNNFGIQVYGGNYDFYYAQKQLEREALKHVIDESSKALRKAKIKEREMIERQQRLDARGKGKQEKAGVARIMMNTLRNKAENSTARLTGVHNERIMGITEQLKEQRSLLPAIDTMKFKLVQPSLHHGKMLFQAKHVNIDYGAGPIWKSNLDIEIRSGERIALNGDNGSGKTSFIRMMLGDIAPATGSCWHAQTEALYIDQEYSLLTAHFSVYEQARVFNDGGLQEHEIKIRLSRFLFDKNSWDKNCGDLSGGERMRLMLCCITMIDRPVDLIILDEPTNNLDIRNVEFLAVAIREYSGTLIVVSHDEIFLEQIRINRAITFG